MSSGGIIVFLLIHTQAPTAPTKKPTKPSFSLAIHIIAIFTLKTQPYALTLVKTMNSTPSGSTSIEGGGKAVSQNDGGARREESTEAAKTQQPPPLPDRSLLDIEIEEDDNEEETGKDQNNFDDESSMPMEKEKTDGMPGLQMTQPKTRTIDTGIARFPLLSDSAPLLETFVQQASRVQSLVLSALQKPSLRRNKRRREDDDEDEVKEEPAPQRRRRIVESNSHLESMLREKTNQLEAIKIVSRRLSLFSN